MNKRDELLAKAQSLIDENKIKEANQVMDQIREMDKEAANKRALQDNQIITDITKKGVNIKGGTVIDSINSYGSDNTMKSVFLNKSEKLTDKITINEENAILRNDGALSDVIRGMVTGKWNNSEMRNLVTTTTTGVLIPELLSAKIIDLARDKSLFGNAGVPMVPMENNNITISRVKQGPTFTFKEEGKEGAEASFELDSIELKSKTAYGYAYISLEAINSSANLESIIYKVFSEAMAQCIDKAFLYGQNEDGFAPSGIMNDNDINKIVATPNGGYDDIIKAIGKVKASNGVPTTLGINSNTEELLSLLKTSDGQYLTAPRSVENLNKIVSNQLNYDEVLGSDALVFDPQALLIGMQNNIQVKMIEDTECLKKGLVAFQIYAMLDCKAVTPKNICKISGIK